MNKERVITTISLNQINESMDRSRSKGGNGELGIYPFMQGLAEVNRTSIINHLLIKYDYKTYLEIGVRGNENYNQILAPKKYGVDPEPRFDCTHKMTSNEFFETHIKDLTFDLVFIDGLHLEEQVTQDIENALAALNPGGIIVMHDCNPPSEFHQRENYEVDGQFPSWNGTTWRSFAKLRCTRPDLLMAVVDTDWGVGLIRPGDQRCFEANVEDCNQYSFLEKNREDLMNLIPVQEFLKIF